MWLTFRTTLVINRNTQGNNYVGCEIYWYNIFLLFFSQYTSIIIFFTGVYQENYSKKKMNNNNNNNNVPLL
jgi:hypothetical protein